MALKTWQVVKRCSEGRYAEGKKFKCIQEDRNYIQYRDCGLYWASSPPFQINNSTMKYTWIPIKSR